MRVATRRIRGVEAVYDPFCGSDALAIVLQLATPFQSQVLCNNNGSLSFLINTSTNSEQ